MFGSPHRLLYRQEVSRGVDEVFAFFSDARNLEKLTPPHLHFKILTPMPIDLKSGITIDYRLKLFGLGFQWRTLITEWDPPHQFADEQARGPYHFWRHTHRFWSRGDSTIIDDEVLYRLPLEPLGRLGLPMVKWQLHRIFEHRHQTIAKKFAAE